MKDQNFPRIFVVEDNLMYQELIASTLEATGFTNVSRYTFGNECVQDLHTMPDIVFLDYGLDDMDGIEVLKKIKAFDPDIQVIFLSGQEDLDIALNTLKYGAFDYVIKDEHAISRVMELMKRMLEIRRLILKHHSKVRLRNKVLLSTLVLSGLLLGYSTLF